LLSYQHGYHAGNAADVHKHLALVLLLQKLRAKDAAFCFVDAHAGRGLYDLDSESARKTGEAAQGILKLVAAKDPPASVRTYLDLVAGHNRPDSHRFYPGSALLAQALLREQDRALLLELHPQEVVALKEAMVRDRRISVHKRDCYEGLPALLPPAIRRGLVLLDPSYEIRSEYEAVVDLLEQSLARWSNGLYLLWYPLLPDDRHLRLIRRLEALLPPKTLVSEFRFSRSVIGLQGSGLIIVNTPWHIDDELAAAMPAVTAALASGTPGRYAHRWLGD
jgi:23S rRNA (adenine2030-N6)-methyltransferase